MFRAIWEFAQSRDCVAHSRNPENAQAISGLRNTCAISRLCNYSPHSWDSENAQHNLEVAQILRLHGTYICVCVCITAKNT